MDIFLDIETVPLKPGEHLSEDGNDIGALSPITGKIMAVGWSIRGEPKIAVGEEKEVLEKFWDSMRSIHTIGGTIRFIGFNIRQFDMHFILVRSLAHNLPIVPFARRSIVDLRDILTLFQRKKGTLQDYALMLGESKFDNWSHEDIFAAWEKQDLESITLYLEKDIDITKKLYMKLQKLNMLSLL
ncbi:MAG: hypothetical protein ACI8Y7_000338 [Candidatus Woesearchaeota archaeon]|jgi:hypothetical protein